jgi:hypothetical protein
MSFSDPEWKPTKKQELFLSLPWSIFEAAYGGGNGSGKSDILLVYGVCRKLHENPKFKQVFQRRTYMELKNEIVPRSRELYTKFGATFNKTDMAWTFPRPDQFGARNMTNGGAMIFLGHCEHEDDVHKYDSMEINLYTPDELTSYTEYIYIYIGFTRVRTNDPLRMVNGQLLGLPAAIRTAGMPGGIGHTFFKKRFVTPCPEGGKIIIGKGGVKRFYVHATVADNPNADPEYAGRLDAIPNEAERKARKFGDWDAYAGQVFDEFRDRHYPSEPENALHVIEPFEIPEWWPKMIIGDWGYTAMTYIGFYAISPSKRLYLYRELYWLKTKIEEWAPVIKDYNDRENPRIVKFCKSAGQDRGQEHTIQEQIETALGRPIELSNNSPGSRVSGKMMVHEYLRWKPRPVIPVSEMPIYSEEKAMWVLRNKGLIEYKSYLSLFDPPEEETNIPRLQIFKCSEEGDHESHPNCCPIMIDAIRACSYAKNSPEGKPAEDVAEFNGDDPYDDLRYAVDSAEVYFNEAQDEFQKVVKQQELIARLTESQNMTAFYIAMRKNEETAKQTMVRRYHRAGRR